MVGGKYFLLFNLGDMLKYIIIIWCYKELIKLNNKNLEGI